MFFDEDALRRHVRWVRALAEENAISGGRSRTHGLSSWSDHVKKLEDRRIRCIVRFFLDECGLRANLRKSALLSLPSLASSREVRRRIEVSNSHLSLVEATFRRAVASLASDEPAGSSSAEAVFPEPMMLPQPLFVQGITSPESYPLHQGNVTNVFLPLHALAKSEAQIEAQERLDAIVAEPNPRRRTAAQHRRSRSEGRQFNAPRGALRRAREAAQAEAAAASADLSTTVTEGRSASSSKKEPSPKRDEDSQLLILLQLPTALPEHDLGLHIYHDARFADVFVASRFGVLNEHDPPPFCSGGKNGRLRHLASSSGYLQHMYPRAVKPTRKTRRRRVSNVDRTHSSTSMSPFSEVENSAGTDTTDSSAGVGTGDDQAEGTSGDAPRKARARTSSRWKRVFRLLPTRKSKNRMKRSKSQSDAVAIAAAYASVSSPPSSPRDGGSGSPYGRHGSSSPVLASAAASPVPFQRLRRARSVSNIDARAVAAFHMSVNSSTDENTPHERSVRGGAKQQKKKTMRRSRSLSSVDSRRTRGVLGKLKTSMWSTRGSVLDVFSATPLSSANSSRTPSVVSGGSEHGFPL